MGFLIGIFLVLIVIRIVKTLAAESKPARKKSEHEISIEFSDSRSRPKGKPAKWHGQGETANIRGYSITSGLIYVGGNLPDGYGYQNDACIVNPNLKVSAASPRDSADEMGYWPHYETISPKHRGAYLEWLAEGRSDPDANIGYIFLFFYGLERRLFVDGQQEGIPDAERKTIVDEVLRLKQLYNHSRSFQGYATNLLAMEWVLYRCGDPIPDYIDFGDRYCSEPFQVALAQYVVAGKPIPASIARNWIALHPEFGLRTPARRCAKEFETLFAHRYKQQFGQGLVIKPNKTSLKLDYRAASPSLNGLLDLKTPELPNPFVLKAPIKKLAALVEECTKTLDPYSRYLGRKGNDPDSLSTWALLPQELLNQSPIAETARRCLSEICKEGIGLTTMKNLFGIFGEPPPAAINKKEAESIAALVEGMGYGMAPDVRYHGIKPETEGTAAIFPNGHGIDFSPSQEYRLMNAILRLGAMVSQIDEDISPKEEDVLRNLVLDNRNLTNIEKDSLCTLLHWSLRTPQKTTGLKKTFADVGESEKDAISNILITVAHADGRIDPREIKELEKLYTTLGLDKQRVANDLHRFGTTDEPVTVGKKDPASDFIIPTRPKDEKEKSGFSLNEALVKIRQEETHQVKGILETIFADEADEPIESEDQEPQEQIAENPLGGLDETHQNLFHKLIQKESWERSALHDLCKEMGLMLDGAMEILNEWSFEKTNAPLIDDGEPVYVDVEIAREIVDA